MKRPILMLTAVLAFNAEAATPISSFSATTNPSDNTWMLVEDLDEPSAKTRKLAITNLALPVMRDGKTFVVAGVIRNTGAGWDVLDGASHTNINILSVANDTEKIEVTFPTASRVLTAVVQGDDAYATNGVFFRTASVTQDTIEIVPFVNRTLGGYFRYNGSTWDVYGDTSAISFTAGTGNVQVWHTAKPLYGDAFFGVSVNCRSATYVAGLDDMGANYFHVKFVNHAGSTVTTADTSMRAYWMRRDFGNLDPNDLTAALGNIWVWAVCER